MSKFGLKTTGVRGLQSAKAITILHDSGMHFTDKDDDREYYIIVNNKETLKREINLVYMHKDPKKYFNNGTLIPEEAAKLKRNTILDLGLKIIYEPVDKELLVEEDGDIFPFAIRTTDINRFLIHPEEPKKIIVEEGEVE